MTLFTSHPLVDSIFPQGYKCATLEYKNQLARQQETIHIQAASAKELEEHMSAGLMVQMKQREEENSKRFQEQLSQELAKLKVSVERAELPPAEPYIAGRERRRDCGPGATLCKESKQKGI